MKSPYNGYRLSTALNCIKDVLGVLRFSLATMEAIVVFKETSAKLLIDFTISSFNFLR